MEYGYIRVSTKEQNEQRQLIALSEFGIRESHIFMDKQSGKDFARPNYQKLIRKLKSGDTIVIKSIDRLGRNTGTVADHNQRETGRCCCVGYAAVGHAAKPGSYRNVDRRYRSATTFLCGADRARIYSSAASRGNRSSKTKGCKIWKTTNGATGSLPTH